jgi:hypothetical protein
MFSEARAPQRRRDRQNRLPFSISPVLQSSLALALLAGSCAAAPLSGGKLASVLRVGPGRSLTIPSAAARVAKDGDVIEIDAGTYDGDVAVWRRNNLTIRGAGGRAHLRAQGQHAEGKAIWVIKGANTTVENIEFSGARVRDRNGAGIRQEGPGLIVRNCYFHDNENGILGGRSGEILIEHSEFANNGAGDGHSHNLYIGTVDRFTLRASYVHHARVGHNVKSRAQESYILYNRIGDEQTGTGSYAIDLPNGGVAFVIGNEIQQGPRTENATLIAYAKEQRKHPAKELYVVNNTLVNDRAEGGVFVFVSEDTEQVKILNNIFAGAGTVLRGKGSPDHNVAVSDPGFRDRAGFDYRLMPGSPAIDAGIEPGAARGFDLTPVAEYVHKAREQPRPRAGKLDCGAHEHRP